MLLQTIYNSNIPVNCHILKGRLESDGLNCFVHDEQTVWVHPFYAAAIGGVKLKVPADQLASGQNIMGAVRNGKLPLARADLQSVCNSIELRWI